MSRILDIMSAVVMGSRTAEPRRLVVRRVTTPHCWGMWLDVNICRMCSAYDFRNTQKDIYYLVIVLYRRTRWKDDTVKAPGR